jgi:hypothetical protein
MLYSAAFGVYLSNNWRWGRHFTVTVTLNSRRAGPLFESGSELRTIRSLAGFQVTTDHLQPRRVAFRLATSAGMLPPILIASVRFADLPFEILRLHFEGEAVGVRGTKTVFRTTSMYAGVSTSPSMMVSTRSSVS